MTPGSPVMRRHARTLLIALTCLGVSAGFAGAQFIVFDALTTAKNAVIAGLKEQGYSFKTVSELLASSE